MRSVQNLTLTREGGGQETRQLKVMSKGVSVGGAVSCSCSPLQKAQ